MLEGQTLPSSLQSGLSDAVPFDDSAEKIAGGGNQQVGCPAKGETHMTLSCKANKCLL